MFLKKDVLKNFAKFTGKQRCQSLFFDIKNIKRRLYRCFPVNFAKFLQEHVFCRTPPVAASVNETIFVRNLIATWKIFFKDLYPILKCRYINKLINTYDLFLLLFVYNGTHAFPVAKRFHCPFF